jgi:hypothetical protein
MAPRSSFPRFLDCLTVSTETGHPHALRKSAILWYGHCPCAFRKAFTRGGLPDCIVEPLALYPGRVTFHSFRSCRSATMFFLPNGGVVGHDSEASLDECLRHGSGLVDRLDRNRTEKTVGRNARHIPVVGRARRGIAGRFSGDDHTSFRLQKGRLRRLLAWPPALALRSLRRVVRRDHRIVSRQLPLRAVFVRRHSERRQVPPQRFEFKAVAQTHEIIWCDSGELEVRARLWGRETSSLLWHGSDGTGC